MKTRQLINEIKAAGGVLARVTGDHHIYKLPNGQTLAVPFGGTRNEASTGMYHKTKKALRALQPKGHLP